MAKSVALLRAVNVGGTKVLMKDLVKLCEKAGFANVRTLIASGNVILEGTDIKATLEKALAAKYKKPIGVIVRTAAELEKTLAKNPFSDKPPNRVIVFFCNEAPGPQTPKNRATEEIAVVGREVFVHYPLGQGPSKLKLPAQEDGTGRNINTVTKLLALARGEK